MSVCLNCGFVSFFVHFSLIYTGMWNQLIILRGKKTLYFYFTKEQRMKQTKRLCKWQCKIFVPPTCDWFHMGKKRNRPMCLKENGPCLKISAHQSILLPNRYNKVAYSFHENIKHFLTKFSPFLFELVFPLSIPMIFCRKGTA